LLCGVEQLLTIGEFAQRCGLSRSALRFYDENGLLRPRIVDQGTGYRYYAFGQLSEALLVRRLRAAEMPVAVLREYLAGEPAVRAEILDRHTASFRERARVVEAILVELRGERERAGRGVGERWCAVAPDEFAAALEQVSFAVADPAERPELAVVWVETRERSLRLVATDSFRLAVRDLVPGAIGESEVRGAIDAGRARALKAQVQTARSLTLSQAADGVLNCSVDGQSVAIGAAGDGFPDYERILSELPLGSQAVLARGELEDALQRIPTASESVELRFGAAGLVLQSDGVTAPVPGSWPGADLTVWLDRQFLTEAVRATVGPDVTIEAVDPLQPITLRSADTGTFSVLTMPVRPPTPA
jgi:DNA polymerase-3 subunit beta